jgi:hypothetical protein
MPKVGAKPVMLLLVLSRSWTARAFPTPLESFDHGGAEEELAGCETAIDRRESVVDGFGVVVGGQGGMLASLGGSASASLSGLESVQGCGSCDDLGREGF